MQYYVRSELLNMTAVPEYPRFKTITPDDAALFNEFFRKYPALISEHTFTNLFIWRNYHNLLWTLWNGFLCIIAHPAGRQPFFLPPVGGNNSKDCIRNCLLHLKNSGMSAEVQRVPEEVVEQHLSDNDEFELLLDRNNCDYVYRSEDLIKLPGNKYHRKKNQISQFKKKYGFQYHPLSADLVPQCLQLETQWCDMRHCDRIPSLSGEERAIHEALTNMHALNFKGGVIVIDGKIEAFTLGEQLNADTAVIHIEKANPAFEGLYQTLNQMFCQQEWQSVTYINREQDLGEEGLRNAKLSYLPHHFVNKYTIRLKD